MTSANYPWQTATDKLRAWARLLRIGIGVPVGLISILAMMILPLPPVMLDMLFTFNIALSLVIVMAVFNVKRPLEFAIFPTVLLLVTILRLALNVASTRVVLLHGHEGSHAAGKVIEAFGEFVIGGNFAVGAVVFIVLIIINFVVVTKGAGRVSEVSARFTLDAMPGKQMAIDADLNAGIITQDEARARRAEVRAEADFYGSMDGASKFVRGDAVAGILIMVINIIGGLLIGTMMHDLPMGEATKTYTLLTIGDGLVAQIPGLLLSVAVAIIVTRVTREQDMGSELGKQLFGQPKALGVAAAVLGIMGLIPGMPNIVFLSIAGAVRLRRVAHGEEARSGRGRCPCRARTAATAAVDRSAGTVLGRRASGRRHRSRSRLSPGPAGRSHQGRRLAGAHPRHPPQAHAGARLPRAGRAHPRQPRARAERLPHQARRRGDRRERGASGSRARDQPGPRVRPAERPRDARSGLRHGSHLDRAHRCANTRSRSATPWSTRPPSSRRIFRI